MFQHVCPVLNMKYGVFEKKEGDPGLLDKLAKYTVISGLFVCLFPGQDPVS